MPKFTEYPEEALVARHQAEIAPLLKKRYIFAESENFVLYDFWNGYGSVNENVFAYSNRLGEDRSVVLYNNTYDSTSGTIKVSVASMDKGSGELRQRTLSEGLALPGEYDNIIAFRDHARGLEFLRRGSALRDHGLHLDLRGYQYAVLLDWRDLQSTAEQPWDRLCDALNGGGVANLHEALTRLRFQPLHAPLRRALNREQIEAFANAAQDRNQAKLASSAEANAPLSRASVVSAGKLAGKTVGKVSRQKAADRSIATSSVNGQGPVLETTTVAADGSRVAEAQPSVGVKGALSALPAYFERANEFYWRLTEVLPEPQRMELATDLQAGARQYRQRLEALVEAALALPELARTLSSAWPQAVREVMPGAGIGVGLERTWAPLMGYLLVHALPGTLEPQSLFDSMDLRAGLAGSFDEVGLNGEDAWRAAAKVRLLLAGRLPLEALHAEGYWADGDVRWLSGVN